MLEEVKEGEDIYDNDITIILQKKKKNELQKRIDRYIDPTPGKPNPDLQ